MHRRLGGKPCTESDEGLRFSTVQHVATGFRQARPKSFNQGIELEYVLLLEYVYCRFYKVCLVKRWSSGPLTQGRAI